MTADVSKMMESMSPRQGKVLRYVVVTPDQPVTPDRCVVKTEWSDLPHTVTQARKALSDLVMKGLVERVDKGQYTATDSGKEVIKIADKDHWWQAAPDPSVTNKFLHRKDK